MNAKIIGAFFASHGLPEPQEEYRFHPDRKWRFDWAWPLQLVALEVEGGIWARGRHVRPVGFLKDMEKYNAAAALGWRVFRCVPEKLCTRDVAQLIHAAFLWSKVDRVKETK